MVPDGEYNDSVVVVYELVPGERYYLGSVSFVGNTKATQEELRKGFGLADGVPFKRADIDKAIERARRVVSNQGYACAEFGVDRHLDLVKHEVHLVLHMQHEDGGKYFQGEGDIYHLARVDLRGNFQTKDAVVRRAVVLKPGDLWNDDANDGSKRQIERTGLFKNSFDHPLRILPQYPDDQPGIANVRVDPDEDSTGTLNFQVGYSSASGVFVQAGFGERNVDLWGFFTSLFGDAWENEGYRSSARRRAERPGQRDVVALHHQRRGLLDQTSPPRRSLPNDRGVQLHRLDLPPLGGGAQHPLGDRRAELPAQRPQLHPRLRLHRAACRESAVRRPQRRARRLGQEPTSTPGPWGSPSTASTTRASPPAATCSARASRSPARSCPRRPGTGSTACTATSSSR